MDDALRKQWQQYAQERTLDQRNALVERYLYLADIYAGRQLKKLPRGTAEFDDLYSAAYQGLIKAVPRFDLDRGISPVTFLACRVRGEILDFLRLQDHVTRTRRAQGNRIAEWEQMELRRPATDDEVYFHFGFRILRPPNVSLDAPISQPNARLVALKDTLVDDSRPDDYSQCSYLLRGLNKRERLIVLLYYVEGLKMKEVGQSVGISKSRISQMMAGLLERMRFNARQQADQQVA